MLLLPTFTSRPHGFGRMWYEETRCRRTRDYLATKNFRFTECLFIGNVTRKQTRPAVRTPSPAYAWHEHHTSSTTRHDAVHNKHRARNLMLLKRTKHACICALKKLQICFKNMHFYFIFFPPNFHSYKYFIKL